MNASQIDQWEKELDRYIATGSGNIVIRDWAPVALSLKKDGGAENRVQQIRNKVLRVYDIMHGYDMPDPHVLFPENLVNRMAEAITDKGELDWHEGARLLSEMLMFNYVSETGEFLYYDPEDGTWKDHAEDVIRKGMSVAYPGMMSRYVEEETIAEIKRTHLEMGEFQQEKGVLVNVQNGVINISTGQLLPHSPHFRFRYVLPVKYDHRAFPSKFLQFLEEVCADDLNKALKALEFYAYCLLPGYPIEKAMTILGRGNNGKSVYLSVLSAFLGKKNIVSIPLQTIAYSRFATAELRNKLANIAGDVSGGNLKDTSTFKLLTGGALDYIDAEIKYAQRRPQFVNTAKLLFAFNQLPKSRDQTMAFFRRFEILKFLQDFTGKEDKQLISKLTTDKEMSGLLNLLVRLFIPALAKKETFHQPMTIEEIQFEYNLSADPSLAFILERIQADENGQIQVDELYRKLVEFCKEKGLNIPAPESFGYSLLNLSGLIVYKKRKQEDNIRKDWYIGIKYVDTIFVKSAITLDSTPPMAHFGSLVEALNSYANEHLENESGIGVIAFLSPYMTRAGVSCKGSFKPMTPMAPMADYIQLVFNSDISIAWKDRDWFFRNQDIAHVPRELGEMLLKRGIGKEIASWSKRETRDGL